MAGGGDPRGLAPELEKLLQRVAPEMPVNTLETMTERFALNTADARFQTVLLVIFGSIAVVLAVVGVFGTLATSVRQRRQEIAVRSALGATSAQLGRLVLAQGGRLLAGGVAVGVLGCFLTGRLLSSLLYGVHPADPVAVAALVGLVAVASLVAAYLPARRATRTNPAVVLRQE